jgi:glycosyltransferase involved in cell wall biosynthesis
MKILLIANYLPDGQQSMQRYAAILQEGFTAAGHEVRLIRPTALLGKLGAGGKWFGYFDKFVLFPRELRRAAEWADVVHICDHSNAIYVKYLENRLHVVTCHDLLAVRSALGEFPGYPTRWSGRQLQRMIVNGLSRARNIVCVSEATRVDVERLLPGGDRNVICIYNGLNYPYEPMPPEEAARRLQELGLSPDQPFILHVGGNQWYKNRAGVLKIFAALRKRIPNLLLVMAGKPWTGEMRELARELGLENAAVERACVSEEDLRALYSSAEALLFPSLAEGFGWPVAEALACGCAVVTSNRAPMTEVGGSAATYIDPLDHEPAAMAVASVIGSRRSRKLRAGFSTAAMIDGYLALYRSLLGEVSSPAAGELTCVSYL